MSFVAVGLSIAGSAVSFFGAKKASKEAEQKQAAADRDLARMKGVYSSLDTSNPFAGMQNEFAGMENQFAGMENQFAGMKNQYSNMENTMEDLTINQKQFDLERQMFQQSQANVLDSMRDAAGGSGIAATVQALAGQGQLAAQKAAAQIGQQESANQQAAASQAGQLQQLEAGAAERMDLQARQGAADVDRLTRQGAADVDIRTRQGAQDVAMAIAGGEQAAQRLEMDKQGTLLGMEQQAATAAADRAAQAKSDKTSALGGMISSVAGIFGSDRKLKKNIKLIGNSPSGLKIYAFEYIDKAFGTGVFQGVMSDEVPSDTVVKHPSGYDMVNYSKIDVEFKNIS